MSKVNREIGVLFGPAMVGSLNDDIKTQTRRICALPPAPNELGQWEVTTVGGTGVFNARGEPFDERAAVWHTRTGKTLLCPYGQPGTRIWVKEAHYLYGHWQKNGSTAVGKQKWMFVAQKNKGALFEAPAELQRTRGPAQGWWRRNSLFMPKWASRTRLEITRVSAERLQDITEEAARAEGVRQLTDGSGAWVSSIEPGKQLVRCETAREAYRLLWGAIHGDASWLKNPLLWVIEFKKVTA